ncbi:ImmA/IrrE family metallo-endopeptidase [Enterococcus faecalis]|uniref:Uncharacterized protein n=1 Tax=Enterococcus faecalis TaxID=1351 RepID=A0AC59HU32_ENTFL|nr:ImmA/IrrE family metallo-endopeptidase [Enterococcus faecalis]BDQ47509.1 hypothetical protein EfsSVR2085_29470 [Enterococcus faecalis]BDQ51741.1 hypothetical protein EfsSVR2281_35520 [Enterococcus faecalis]BDQ63272.1 hypothetical protein EfsSVR2332_33500 [Enterococcus faecalis]
MYNKKMLEYRDVDSEDYNNYSENALFLLKVISDWAAIPISEITYHEVIDYFVNNFNIEIVFFDDNDRIINPDYKFINDTIYKIYPTFKERVSGFTVTDGYNYKIFLNFDMMRHRLIFTILHELAHIYFHCSSKKYMQIFASLNIEDHYPKEILPFEDEANIIASILYLNDTKLINYILEGNSFHSIMSLCKISKAALHCRIMNYLIHNIGLNKNTALFKYLNPYKEEVFGQTALKNLQSIISYPSFIKRLNQEA